MGYQSECCRVDSFDFFVPRLVVGPHIPRGVVVRSELCVALQTVLGVAFAALRGCSTIRLGSVRLLLRSLFFRPELCRGLSLHTQSRAHVASFCSGSGRKRLYKWSYALGTEKSQ